MKKILSLVLSFALVLSVLVFPVATFTASAENAQSAELTFSDAITVLDESISPRAIRTKVLSDGTVAAVYYRSGSGIYYATSTNGGVTFSEGVKIVGNATDADIVSGKVTVGATQTALAQKYVSEYGQYGRGRLEAQNPNLVELKNGDVAAFYRYNTFETDPTNKPWSMYYASICYQILDKETGVWGDVQVMYECTEENVVADAGSPYGVWEPDPVYIGEELFCYFADTDLPGNTNYQHIMYCVYDEETGKFGAPEIAQNGIEHKSRDGMSVVTKLSDGTYAMVFESTRTDKDDYADIHNYTTFVIKMSFSNDGRNWSEPVIVAKPNPVTAPATDSNEYAVCAAPYVVTLPDGRLAVSYQTTDRYTGRTPNRVSYRIGTQVAISSQPITSATFAGAERDDDVTSYFATEVNPGVLGENEFSKSASLMVHNDKLYVYYSVGDNTWTTTDGVETEKHNFGDVRMAYMQLPVEKDTTDYTSLDNYIVYQANAAGTAPTDENGKITIASPGTTNLVAGSGTVITENVETPVADLFDESNYTEYNTKNADRTTANAENSTIAISGVTKLKFNNTSDLGQFKASSILKVRETDGYIQSGYTFYAQDEYFTSEAYNTPGYEVILRRQTANLAKLELVVRYVYPDSSSAIKNVGISKVLSTTLSKTDFTCKFRLDVEVTKTQFIVNVYQVADSGSETKLGSTYTFDLDYTGTNASTKVYNSGSFYLMTNGATTYSDLSISKIDHVKVDTTVFDKATNLKAHGVFNMLEEPGSAMYGGFSFHVKDAAAVTAGLSGYTVKLLQSADDLLKVELSVYELNEDKSKCTNKKSYAVDITEDVLGAGVTTANAKIALDVTVIDDTVTVVVTNYNNTALTHTQVFDLNNYYSYAEYLEGGFGIYKHGTGTISVEDVSFTVLPLTVNNITDDSVYTVYAPDESAGVTYQDNAFVNNDAVTKKIMLKDLVASDLKANATFEVGFDGNIKGGIIFRASNVGNAVDAMEGYSVAIWKNAHTTGNNGRIVLFVYKWGRNADGELMYLGEVARLVDTTSFNDVYPDAEKDILASAGAHIKVNAEVEGNNVTAWFEVLDENNSVAATSGTLKTTLDAKSFASEADATVYNSGAVGVSISTLGSVCDFNIVESDDMIETSNISGYDLYSSDSKTFVTDDINNKIYSTTAGQKQAVLSGIALNEFKASATMKSTTAGATYNMGFDFMINESTHSGAAFNTNDATRGYEGYRVVLVRNANNSTNPAGTIIYLFKFTKTESGYTRTQIKTASNADFFADYTKYAEIEVDFTVELVDGTLTAKAVMCEHPDKTITLTHDGFEGSGATGWFISGGGSLTGLSVKAPYENAKITAAPAQNGTVFAAVNSGAAGVGDTVKIMAVAKAGYVALAAYTTVNGVKTEIAETADGFVFTKTYGATEISADFAMRGDLDRNDELGADDAIALRKHILSIEKANEKLADCNADGFVNVKDLVNIKKQIAAN